MQVFLLSCLSIKRTENEENFQFFLFNTPLQLALLFLFAYDNL